MIRSVCAYGSLHCIALLLAACQSTPRVAQEPTSILDTLASERAKSNSQALSCESMNQTLVCTGNGFPTKSNRNCSCMNVRALADALRR